MSKLSFLVTLSFLRPSWWWSLISRRSETDYDLILSRLAKDISEAQARLARVRTRDARASVLFTLYALAVWAAVVALSWSIGFLQWHLREGEDPESRARRTLLWIPLALAPVVIFFTRRIVRWWYHRLAEAEETHIRTLRRTQRDKIDEIKAATKFDRLRLLLEKYDDSPSNKANLKTSNRGGGAVPSSSSNPQARPTQGSKSNAPSSYRHSTPDATQLARNNQPNTASSTNFPRSQIGGNQNNNPISPNSAPPGSNHFPTSSQTNPQGQRSTNSAPAVAVQPPGPRTWMDKLGDALLGADPSQMTAEQRYALICEACYAHNGLALKEEIEEIQYVCPRCGHFNSRRPSSTPVSSPFARRNRVDSSATQRERVNSNASRFSFSMSSLTSPTTAQEGGGGGGHGKSHSSNQSLSINPNERSASGVHPYSLKPDGRAYSASHSDLSQLSNSNLHDPSERNSLSNRFGMGGSGSEGEELEELEEKEEGTPRPDRYRKDPINQSKGGFGGIDHGDEEESNSPPSSPLMKEGGGPSSLSNATASGYQENGSPTNVRSRRQGRGDEMDLDD